LADLDSADMIGDVYKEWPMLGAVARQEVIAAATRSRAASEALLSAIEGNVVAAAELPPSVRATLVESKSSELRERAATLLASFASADRESVVARYRDAARLTGDQQRGALLFREHCLTCHAVQNQGGRVGPELAGVGARTNENLLVDILDPSRQVTPDFINYVATTKDGRVMTGLIVAETETSLTLRRAGGEQDVIARDELEELRATGKSIMPDGLEEKVSPQQVADVLEFLRRPDRKLLEAQQ
jgi:putative heme-binding domain-containing protein